MVAIGLAAVLVGLGFIGGVVVERRWVANASDSSEPMNLRGQRIDDLVERLDRELALSRDQSRAVRRVLTSARADVLELRSKLRPELKSVWTKSRSEIISVLNPEQAAKYDQVVGATRKGGKGERKRPDPDELFRELDSNSDGFVTRQECESSSSRSAGRVLTRFNGIDSNADDRLTIEELRAGLSNHRGIPK